MHAGRFCTALFIALALGALTPVARGAEAAKAAPASPRDDELLALVEKAPPRLESDESLWAAYQLPDLRTVARASAKNGLPAVFQALHERFGIGAEAARSLLVSWWWSARIRDEHSWKPSEASLEHIRTSLAAASLAAPGNLAVAVELVANFNRLETKTGWPAALVFAHLERSSDPVAFAMTLARANGSALDGRLTPSGDLQFPLLAFAVHRDPRLLEEAVLLAGRAPSFGLEPTAFALALMRVAESSHASLEIRTKLASIALENLLRNDSPVAASEVYDAAPAEVKAEIAELGPRSPDWRLDLAAALLVTGHPRDPVRHLVETFPAAEPEPQPSDGSARPLSFEREILSFHFGAKLPDDRFDLAVEAFTHLRGGASSWSMLAAPLIAEQYPGVARSLLAESARSARSQKLVDSIVIAPQLKALFAPATELVSRSLERQDQLRRRVLQALPMSNADPARGAVARVLHGKPRQSFSEHVLPLTRTGSSSTSVTPPIPEDFERVRAEAIGERVVAIALAKESVGGYWFLESLDAGRHWKRPVYLGLEKPGRYEVVPESHLPLLAAENLRIEVRRRLPDSGPVATGGTIYLEAKLSELERDTDGDGLTDLLEEKLLLDPKNADTDGDGIPDDRDALPNVSTWGEDGAPPELMAKAFEEIGGLVGLAGASIVAPAPLANAKGNARLKRVPEVPAPEPDAPIWFVVGDRANFHRLATPFQTIVLTPEEADLAEERHQLFIPLRLTVIVDRSGTRAYIESDEHWQGATFEATKTGAEWTLKLLNRWMS